MGSRMRPTMRPPLVELKSTAAREVAQATAAIGERDLAA